MWFSWHYMSFFWVVLFYEYVYLLNMYFVDFVIYIVSNKKNTQFWTTLTLPSGAQNALYMVWSSIYLLVIDSLINELFLWLIEFFTYLSLDLLTILVLVVSSTKRSTHWWLIYKNIGKACTADSCTFFWCFAHTYWVSTYSKINV